MAKESKRRMTIYLDDELVEFLREYCFELEVDTMNKAVIEVLRKARLEWQRCESNVKPKKSKGGDR